MNNMKEKDPLRSENWAGIYADVPEEVNLGVKLAFARIRRREQNRRRMIRTVALAACAVLAVGVGAFSLSSKRAPDAPDRVATSVSAVKRLALTDVVYASRSDACFHVYAACPEAGDTAVELQLVTALEFEKTICATCGANVEIAH